MMTLKRQQKKLAFAAAMVAGLLAAAAVSAIAATQQSSTSSIARHATTPSASSAVSVFDSARAATPSVSADDALTSLTRDNGLVTSDVLPGAADLSRATVLMSGLASESWSVVAAPTSKGEVCDVVLDGRGTARLGGCAATLSPTEPISYSMGYGFGEPTFIAGLVSDDVVGVSVTIGGDSFKATVKNNGIFYELPKGAGSISAIDVELADGSSVSVPVSTPELSG